MNDKNKKKGIQLSQSLIQNDESSNSNFNPNFQSSSKSRSKNSNENQPLFDSKHELKSDEQFGLRRRSFSAPYSDDENTFDETNICKSLQKTSNIFKNQISNYSCMDWLYIFLPCSKWLTTYSWREYFFADLIAGLTVGIMMIPQSMSYAGIAGLPPQYGLYSAFFPVLAYVIFGNSRQLSVGPISITSMLLQEGVTKMIPERAEIHHLDNLNSNEELIMKNYIQKAIQLALLVGVIHVFLGVLRLGFLTNFLSHSVVSGFTTGAVLIIGFSQVKYIMGYKIQRSSKIQVVLGSLFANIQKFQWQEFFMGISWIFILQIFKQLGKKYPRLKFLKPAGPLVVSIIGIVLVEIFSLDKKGIKVVGDIPQGLPPSSIQNWFEIENFPEMIRISGAITVVGLMESISIAKALALKNKYELNPNQELVGLGVANIAGSAFSAYPTTGAFSRSAVANETGAKSGIAGLLTAILVGFILLFLTQVFEKMPMNTLAAIVISGVSGLFDIKTMFYLFKINVVDWMQWMIAFLGTIFLGAEMGLGIAILFTLIIVVFQTVNPKSEILGKISESNIFENIKNSPLAHPVKNSLIIRINAPIYFANAQSIKNCLLKYQKRASEISNQVGHKIFVIILEMSKVERIDAVGIQFLQQIIQIYKENGIQLLISNTNKSVMRSFQVAAKQSDIFSDFVQKNMFQDVNDAVVQYQLKEWGSEVIKDQGGDVEMLGV